MANTSVAITPGSGANIDAYALGSNGDLQQIIRQATADAVDASAGWTVSTTSANPIAANETRMAITLYNASTVRVYLRFDTTTATAANAHWYLDAGDRYEVPYGLCQMPITFIAASAGTGTVNYALGNES